MKTIGWRKTWCHILKIAVFFALSLAALAQDGRLQLSHLENLTNKAAEVNDVTLDGAMLRIALKFIEMDHDPDAAELRSIIRDLKGIYVKNFEFAEPDQYSQSDIEIVRTQLAAPAWTRVVETRSLRSRENAEIYIMRDGDKIAGLAILVADPRELTVVNIVGGIDLDKLDSLDGQFGIHLQHREHHTKPSPEDNHEKNQN